MELCVEAALAAIADAGIDKDAVDGLVDLFERVTAGDELVELQPALLIHGHEARDIDPHFG